MEVKLLCKEEIMEQTKNLVTFGGNPVTLIGHHLEVGDLAPNFHAQKTDLSMFSMDEVKGKKVIISAVPSIDTGVCEAQTRRFNKEADQLDNTVILTISCDLPFAHSRFCASEGIENLIMLSDHLDLDFAHHYGLEIEGLRLLSRAIFVIDEKGVIQYVEYVKEVTNHPDYDKALEAVKAL